VISACSASATVAASFPRFHASRQFGGMKISLARTETFCAGDATVFCAGDAVVFCAGDATVFCAGDAVVFCAGDAAPFDTLRARTAKPTATAWAHNSPVIWFSGHEQRVSTSLGDLNATLTRSKRLPALSAPRHAAWPASASTTAPLSKSPLPSLKDFHEAAARNVASVQPVMSDGSFPVRTGWAIGLPTIAHVPEADPRDGWAFNRCLDFLDHGRDEKRPLFLYLSFLKPHAGANVPAGYEGLYNLQADPKEWDNLYAQSASLRERDEMTRDLIAHLNEVALKKAVPSK
jgi:hypothetical protein